MARWISFGSLELNVARPWETRIWLALATSPAQQGAERLVPPTSYQGELNPPLKESYTATPLLPAACSATSGVVRGPLFWNWCWYGAGVSYWLPPPPLPLQAVSPSYDEVKAS